MRKKLEEIALAEQKALEKEQLKPKSTSSLQQLSELKKKLLWQTG
jgi:hypothetical protein